MSRSPVGGPAPFDPAKCDHGSEHAGRVEFEWCDNCDPFRARILQATGVDPGPNPLLPEPPTDGGTSSEANYDPMTAPVPEGDMNGPHGELPRSSEGGQR